MVNKTKHYSLPDRTSSTTNVDEYISAWRAIAEPIEEALDVELAGFDPSLHFRRGNAQNVLSTHIELPLWFAKLLATTFEAKSQQLRDMQDVMMTVQEQFCIHGDNLPKDFDRRVLSWVDQSVAGTPPNLRG